MFDRMGKTIPQEAFPKEDGIFAVVRRFCIKHHFWIHMLYFYMIHMLDL